MFLIVGSSPKVCVVLFEMGEWNHDLFSCFEDSKTCIIAYVIPCYIFGKNAEKVDESCALCSLAFVVPGLNLFAVTKIRGLIREMSGIEGGCHSDTIVWSFCGLCALVQEARQVEWNREGQLMVRE